jgi:hypothetical protein
MVGAATGQVQLWRNLGGAVGAAVLGSVLTGQLGLAGPEVGALAAALRLVFAVMTGILATGAAVSVLAREVPLRAPSAPTKDNLPAPPARGGHDVTIPR